MSSQQFSYFGSGKGITDTKPTGNVCLQELAGIVKSDKYRSKVQRYRETRDSKIKNSLDYVTPSGIFKTRNTTGLISRSGVFCGDFDGKDNLKLGEKPELTKQDLVFAEYPPTLVFTSPSGKGLKVFHLIDVEAGTHAEYFNAFTNYYKTVICLEEDGISEFNLILDKNCSDISRACYLSHDPEVFINEESCTIGAAFLTKYLAVEIPNEGKPQSITNEYPKDINEEEAIKVAIASINKTEVFEQGNRHNYILRLASTLNRMGVSREASLYYLTDNYIESDFDEKDIIPTVNSSYKNTSLHGVAPFVSSAEKAFSNDESTEYEPSDWQRYKIDLANPVAPPEPLIIQTDSSIPMLHRRNLSTVAASAKVGKTFLLSGIAAAALNDEGLIGLHCPTENTKVLFVDTEMDISDTLEIAKRVHRCNGWDLEHNKDSFVSINLREVSVSTRPLICEAAIKEFHPDLVLLDGIVDLVGDFNNIEESKTAVERLTKWATAYNCHVMTCLHVNKGSAELRGHLGAFLRQKGELTLLLSKKEDPEPHIEVKPIDSRHRPIEDFYFKINEDALPETYTPQPVQKATLKINKLDFIFKSILPLGTEMGKPELLAKVMEHQDIRERMGHRRIKDAEESKVIVKNEKGSYLYNLNFHEEDLI